MKTDQSQKRDVIDRARHCPYLHKAVSLNKNGVPWGECMMWAATALSRSHEEFMKAEVLQAMWGTLPVYGTKENPPFE